jgi:hypothetical protein
MTTRTTGRGWVFDALPPSGARRGGDPSEHAFKHDIETFVREVIQNANDQAIGTPTVSLDLQELRGSALEAFRDAIAWDTFEPHLRAAATVPAGRRVVEHLEQIEKTGRLLLLRVADYDTEGLTGAEDRGDSHFRALCKDTLFSHKRTQSAGGSYGLGKSVLWSFSGLSTVLFASVLREDPPGRRSPRLIGRAELPSHEVGDDGFTGSGWFGAVVALPRGQTRAESIWDSDARELAQAVHLQRDDASGTSILILGFRDPTAEGDTSVGTTRDAIRRAAARFFWPAMELTARRLRVEVGGAHVDAATASDASPFLECWRGRSRAVERLETPGDVVVRPITLELPRRRDSRAALKGRVDLIVRLADERSTEPCIGQVAMFRGAGMVVRHFDHSAMAQSLRPFHAVLACGTGRADDPEPGDDAVEHFLRAAEPPGHDDWISTPALADGYVRGYAKTLQILKDQIAHQLRDALAPSAAHGVEGPERLRRRFPIGRTGGEGTATPSVFLFEELDARFDGARWSFRGALRPAEPGRPWHASIRLHELGEDGRPLGAVPVARVEIEATVAFAVADGVVEIDAPADVQRIAFAGTSEPLAASATNLAELGLEVEGRLEASA